MDPVRFVAAIAGVLLVVSSYYWAAQVLMISGAEPPHVARIVFRTARSLLHLGASIRPNPRRRQNIGALYVPFSLIAILVAFLVLSCVGFALFLYGITQNSARVALENSISAMSVLGFAGLPPTLRETIVAGFEAFTGPIFIALLIGYIVNLNSDYAAQSARVNEMDEKLGKTRNGCELLGSAARSGGLDGLSEIWTSWTAEFADLENSYRSVKGYLIIFSPVMNKHWSSDAIVVLDAANLRNSLVALPQDPAAIRCLESGSTAISHIASEYGRRFALLHRRPESSNVTRELFEQWAKQLRSGGLPIAKDVEPAWEEFQRVRNGYVPAPRTAARL